MASENIQIPALADGAVSQYRFVVGDTSKTTNSKMYVAAAAGSTVPVLGISQNAVANGDDAEHLAFAIVGRSYLEVNANSENLDIGDRLVPTTGGVGIKASAASGTEQHIGAIALEPSTADGDVIRVLIVRQSLLND
jgi:hypothetical protein